MNNLKCSGPVQHERRKSDKVNHQHVVGMQLPHQWLYLDATSLLCGFVGWSRKTWESRKKQGFGGAWKKKRVTSEEEESGEKEISVLELLLFWIQLTYRRLCLTFS